LDHRAARLCVIAASGPGRRFYALRWPTLHDLLVLGSITGASILVFEGVLGVLRRFDIHLLDPEASATRGSANFRTD
jgi:hypothetical protein